MLPNEVLKLTDGFVKAFDSEHQQLDEFKNAIMKGWNKGDIIKNAKEAYMILKGYATYHDDRTRYIWTKCKEIITNINTEPYTGMDSDIKLLVKQYCNPTIQAAELFFEGMFFGLKLTENSLFGFGLASSDVKKDLDHTFSKIYAEIDLFCASYFKSKKMESQGGGPIIHNFTGVYGNVTNSKITLYDFYSVYQVLKDKGIPQDDRNELEDIMDALKESSSTNQATLVERAENWLTKHKEALGTDVEIIGRILGTDKVVSKH